MVGHSGHVRGLCCPIWMTSHGEGLGIKTFGCGAPDDLKKRKGPMLLAQETWLAAAVEKKSNYEQGWTVGRIQMEPPSARFCRAIGFPQIC